MISDLYGEETDLKRFKWSTLTKLTVLNWSRFLAPAVMPAQLCTYFNFTLTDLKWFCSDVFFAFVGINGSNRGLLSFPHFTCVVSHLGLFHWTGQACTCVCSWTWSWAIVLVWQKPLPTLWCPPPELSSILCQGFGCSTTHSHTHAHIEHLPAGTGELHLHYDGRQIKYIPLHTKGTRNNTHTVHTITPTHLSLGQ